MLFADIVRRVSRQFGDTDNVVIGTSGSITNDFYDWLNEGQLAIAKQTNCITNTLTAAASTFPANFPTDFVRTQRVLYGTRALQPVDLETLDSLQINTTIPYGPQYFYTRKRQINFYPLQQTGDTTVVTWDYVATPATIDNTTQVLSIPAIYHDDLVRFCLARAHERNENNAVASSVLDEFKTGLADDSANEFDKDDTYPVIRDDPWDEW